MVGMKVDPGRIRYANLGLEALIMRAFGLQGGDEIVGTPNEFRYPLAYEIIGTFPPDTPQDQIPGMLQKVLTERFKLVVHRETRPTPVYVLSVGKGGVKMKVSQADATSSNNPRRGHLEAKKTSIAVLANRFHNSGWTDRPVMDKTGLTEAYDFVLDWTPDDVAPGELSVPSLFTAVQEQLGLRLEAQVLPREVLVVDHAEKPTEN